MLLQKFNQLKLLFVREDLQKQAELIMITRLIVLLSAKMWITISTAIRLPFSLLTFILNILSPNIVDDLTKFKAQIDFNNIPFVHETTRSTSSNINGKVKATNR